MTSQQFLSEIAAIAALTPRYRLGHVGDDGFCDCIGLIIGAVERCGLHWSGIHGSNWWARHYTRNLCAISSADALALGEMVFKARAPGASGYALPDRYKNDSDQRDYYHVGVVTGVNPLRITHCTTGGGVDGITVDSKIGKWMYHGQLSLLDEMPDDHKEEENDMDVYFPTKATVYAENGGTVNLRKKPSPSGALLDRIPVGQAVSVISRENGWAKLVTVKGLTGYMMEGFLKFEEEEPVEAEEPDVGACELEELLRKMQQLAFDFEVLEERVAALEGGVG